MIRLTVVAINEMSRVHCVVLFQGAYSGLFLGLVFMFWIGVGAQIYKPNNPKAPINITGCNWNLTSTAAPPTVSVFNQSMGVSTSVTPLFNSTEPPPVVEEE
jgi:hypothetical protein